MVVLQNPPIQKSFEFNDDVSYLSAHLLIFIYLLNYTVQHSRFKFEVTTPKI